jgi:hypothetical protein
LAVNAGLNQPWSVCADHSGNLFVADFGHNRIRRVDAGGHISTVAGRSNTGAFGGDGGPATTARLNGPANLALDSTGNLLVADWHNHRVREIYFAGLPTMTLSNVTAANFGNYSVVVSSPSGSVTSSFMLNVVEPPTFSAITFTNGGCRVTWNSQSNLTYQVQYTTDLSAPTWLDLGGRITATSNSVFATDNLGANPRRFYRVKWMP